MNYLVKLQGWLGLDRAIWFTLLNRAWMALAGPVTVGFVVVELSVVEQGYYYAFASLLAMQVFFELGLGVVIMQVTSHVAARVTVVSGRVTGEGAPALATFLRTTVGVFAVISALFLLIISVAGWFFFADASAGGVEWKAPWLLVVAGFSLTMMLNALFSFLEGMGFISQVALARFAQALVSSLALWAALLGGMKLAAMFFMQLGGLAVGSVWLIARHRAFLRDMWRLRGDGVAVNWRFDVWPLQWRIALSWVAGYFASQAITLLAFRYLGPAEAGRIGLTMTLVNAAMAGALAWTSTRAPLFGRLVATRQFAQLMREYTAAYQRTMWIAAAGAVVVLGAIALAGAAMPQFEGRTLPLTLMLLICVGGVANAGISARATLLRAFRKEPYIWLSLAVSLGVVGGAVLGSLRGDIRAIFIVYALTYLAAWLTWSKLTFDRFVARELVP